MWLPKFAVLVLLFALVYGQPRIDPLVNTNLGLIRGLQADDGDYSMFLGIPYAQVDEAKPFGVATPYPKFEAVYDAHNDSIVCPQIDKRTNVTIGTLDCLNLNLYVPTSASITNLLPVAIWLHGGGYREGSGNREIYGPRFLVRHDIIIVSVNYRLGPYGFMCLDVPECPGNQGLKDQLLAMRWVKNNIDEFGGDPNKITIFGESAGSRSVDYHLLSNNEKLYDKAILQSGSALKLNKRPIREAPFFLAKYLGFSTNNLTDALELLAKVDSNLLIAAADNLELMDDFRPCIESEFQGVESILTQNLAMVSVPKVNKMPILIGINDDESNAFYTSTEDQYYENLNLVQEELLTDFDANNDDLEDMEEIVQQFYFGDVEMSAAIKQNVIDFSSDFLFIHPTIRSIYKYLDNEAENIYFYVFSYVGQRNYFRRTLNVTDGKGAAHADELGYLFDVELMRHEQITPRDKKLIGQMTTLWANFIKYGDPTPKPTNLLPLKWTPVTDKKRLPYLNIGTELTLGSRPFHERTAFWDLFYKVYGHLQRNDSLSEL